jgi:hypothetical protein
MYGLALETGALSSGAAADEGTARERLRVLRWRRAKTQEAK